MCVSSSFHEIFFLVRENCDFTVQKNEIQSFTKNSSNQLFSNLFSKIVTFTKILSKMRERIPIISTQCETHHLYQAFWKFFVKLSLHLSARIYKNLLRSNIGLRLNYLLLFGFFLGMNQILVTVSLSISYQSRLLGQYSSSQIDNSISSHREKQNTTASLGNTLTFQSQRTDS